MSVFNQIIPLIVVTLPLLKEFIYLFIAACFLAAVPNLIRRFL